MQNLLSNYGEKWLQEVQHGAECIIEHGSHRTAGGDAVRRAFSYDGRIVGCRIDYVIFLIVVIT